VTDSTGDSSRQVFSITINPAVLALPSASVNPVFGGETTTISAGAVDGSGSYASYAWSGTLPVGCSLPSGTASASFPCTPDVGSTGSYLIVVTVTDSYGDSTRDSFTLTMPSVVTVSSSNGAPGPVSFSVTGLAADTLYDVYLDTSPGVISTAPGALLGTCTSTASGALADCTVTIPTGLGSGVYYVDLYADPSPPPFVLSVFHFTVAPASASPSFLGLPILDLEVAGAVLAAAVIAVTIVVVRRRSRTAPPGPRKPATGR
jgi:hypothetical protein